MLDEVLQTEPDQGELVMFLAAGSEAAGSYACAECGYGITLKTVVGHNDVLRVSLKAGELDLMVSFSSRSEPDLAAHEIDEFLRNGESQSGAAVLPRTRHIGLTELVEDVIQCFFFHSDACVRHREPYHTVVARC